MEQARVTEADATETAQEWLRGVMVEGMTPLLEPIPVVIEVLVG